MRLNLQSCILASMITFSALPVYAYNYIPEPVLDKSQALTMALNFAKVQPYEKVKVGVKNFVINDIKDLNGITRSYEVSLFDDANNPVGYINIPNRAGFDAISNYSFSGESKTQELDNLFTKYVELVELATDNKAFFIGSELGAVGIAVKLDNKELTQGVKNFKKVGDYAVFSQYPFVAFKGLAKELQLREADSEELLLREKLLTGAKNLELAQIEQTTQNFTVPADTAKQTHNSIGGPIGDRKQTDFKGYNQYSIYKDGDDETCVSGCTPTGYMMLLDYWDRNGFPNLIAGPADREQYPIQSGNYYGDKDYQYYVTFNSFNPDDDLIDTYAFKSLLKVRQHLRTQCDATTLAPNVWRGKKYIQEVGYDAKVRRVSGLFGNQRSWEKLKSEIDAGRPVLFSMTLDGTWFAGHSAVAYGYKDVAGTEHDKIYAVMGFGSSKSQELKRNIHIGTTSFVLSEKEVESQTPQTLWQKILEWFRSLRR